MAYPPLHEHGRGAPLVWTVEAFKDAYPAESDLIEFKQGLPETKIAEAVTAFSNAHGGVILLGVSDDGNVVGLDIGPETEARVHRAVRSVRDAGRYETHVLHVGARKVIAVAIFRRREGFGQLPDGRVLIRRGAMNVPLLGLELQSFLSERSLVHFELTATSVEFAQADRDLVGKIQREYGWPEAFVAQGIYELGLTSDPTNRADLTAVGVLFLTTSPELTLGKAFVEIFRHPDQTRYDRRWEITGPVDTQIARSVEAIADDLGSDIVILGLRRHELPRLPLHVLRETLANAVAHRSYENARQPVRVDIWPDRVVVRSPGGLPEPVTIQNIREQNAPRNLSVIKLLRRLRLAEDAGLGVDLMQDAMEAALLDQPIFQTDGTYVSVTLPLAGIVSPQERAWLAELGDRGDLKAGDRTVLLHAARGEVLNNAAVRALLGVDSVHARGSLTRLRNLGFLEQHGERGGSSYQLARELGPPPGLALAHADLVQVVRDIAVQEGQVTNSAVRQRTGLDRAQVLRLLTSMVKSGDLVRLGERRGSRYETAASARNRQHQGPPQK